jgi:hypothetical protein
MSQEMVLQEERLGISRKIKSFFVNPKEFFLDNRTKNPWFLMFFMIVLSTSMIQAKTMTSALVSMDVGADVGEEGIAIISKLSTIFGLVTGALGSAVSILISAFIILLCVKFIFKSEITYKQVLSVYCFSNIPNIILNVFILTVYNKISETLLLSDLTTLIIRHVNIFTIWFVILLIIGISAVSKISMKKSIILFLTLSFLTITFTIGSYLIADGMGNDISNMDLQMYSE